MPLMTWTEDCSVKIESIDAQHKMLFSWVNDLYDAMCAGRADQELGQILYGLVQYTRYHFLHEEKLMQDHGYPDYLNHKAQHDALRKRVDDFQAQFQSGNAGITTELMDFLKNWVSNHIQISDKSYSAHLIGKGVS